WGGAGRAAAAGARGTAIRPASSCCRRGSTSPGPVVETRFPGPSDLIRPSGCRSPVPFWFGIVFDAGSSHTSLFVYQWPADKENDTGVVSQALACQVKGPGISSYASDPAQAGESLRGCLEEALAKNSSQAEHIFAEVAQVLGRAPLAFWGAELLAGQDEGALGWITGREGPGRPAWPYSFSGEWIRPPEGTLVGALDMGGASTQITFVPGGPIRDESTQASFRLYGFEHRVYTHSYLCFGRDQMLNRLLGWLVQNFYHTFHFLNLTAGQPLATVNATVWEFCQKPWKLVEGAWPEQQDPSERPPWPPAAQGRLGEAAGLRHHSL
ncbi:PREDICTED: ectonucleoside triphosphate diphosphohydrolase 8, partial [Myotis brandtii]|uniref:ectonucleoside triphosphate diphosphohydrolase 8 n=1 Tax=Myotis brandtii TaxID=109478 RepID=UPI00070422AD